jgi:uncharacterized protein
MKTTSTRSLITISVLVIILGAIAGGLDVLRTSKNSDAVQQGFTYATTGISVGSSELILEIADTPDKRSLGLSNRESLAEDKGMLFTFDEAKLHGFWMKDMLFPIDIAWLNDKFCIVYLIRKASPSSYPTIYAPGTPVRYVIETTAGYFTSHNLAKGSCLEAPVLQK